MWGTIESPLFLAEWEKVSWQTDHQRGSHPELGRQCQGLALVPLKAGEVFLVPVLSRFDQAADLARPVSACHVRHRLEPAHLRGAFPDHFRPGNKLQSGPGALAEAEQAHQQDAPGEESFGEDQDSGQ